MTHKTIAEIVQTGNVFTGFVLKPYHIIPEKVVESVHELTALSYIEVEYPDAELIDPQKFSVEVDRRIHIMLEGKINNA